MYSMDCQIATSGESSVLSTGERTPTPTMDASDHQHYKLGQDVTDSKDDDITDSKIQDTGHSLASLGVGDSKVKNKPDNQSVTDGAVRAKTNLAAVAKKSPPLEEAKYIYKMNYKSRGMALIINNLHFDPNTGMSDRVGTDQDASALCHTFKALEFEVKLFKDLSKRNMMKLMLEASQVNHGDNDCFACVILSHGEEGEIYGRDGKISIDDLVAPFKGDQCKSLAGKPKLFFFQACRGSMLDSGIEVTDSEPEVDGDEVDSVAHRIPTEADFLMCYSVVTGYFSWRNSARGSWFIQSLCQALDHYGSSLEIMRVMTRVNHKVSYDFESNAAKEYMTRKKQVPCIVSMLTKELYFKPKK